jgi:hypothetical protein
MELTARIEAGSTPGSSVLVGVAAVVVNGKFAQFGGRMMAQMSDMLLAQFADKFRAAAAASALAGAAAAATPAPRSANPTNALALFWALIRGWCAGRFGKRA